MDVANPLSGLEEHIGQDEREVLAAGDEVQAVLAGEGGEQAIDR